MPKIQLFLLVSEVLLFKMVQCEGLLYAKLQGSHGPSLYVLPYIVLQATNYSQMIKVPIQNKNKKPKEVWHCQETLCSDRHMKPEV